MVYAEDECRPGQSFMCTGAFSRYFLGVVGFADQGSSGDLHLRDENFVKSNHH